MSRRLPTRRTMLQATLVGALTGGSVGCGGAAAVTGAASRVVVQVACRGFQKLLKAIINNAGKLIVSAVVSGVSREIQANLSEQDQTALKKGGKLILRDEEGNEHEVAFTYKD